MDVILYAMVFLLGLDHLAQLATSSTPTANVTTTDNSTNATYPNSTDSLDYSTQADPASNSTSYENSTQTSPVSNVTILQTTNATGYVAVITNTTPVMLDSTSQPTTPTTPTQLTTTDLPYNCSVPGNECANNATCENSRCECLEGYTGKMCEFSMHCNDTTCMNGGSCVLADQSYKCNCSTGDTKKSCALNTANECLLQTLNPYGTITCIDRIDSYELICNQNHTGDGCFDTAHDDFCKRYGAYNCSVIDYCKPRCNLEVCGGKDACTFTISPFEGEAFINNSICINDFANGIPNVKCENEDLLFDGLDQERLELIDCSPYFTTVCTESFNNGQCNPVCNNSHCMYDGGDCLNKVHSFIPGGVVLELKSLNWKKAQTVTQLLLRSGVTAKPKPFPRPHVYMKVKSSQHFKRIPTVGKFLAAAFAKLPDLIQLTDIFYCDKGNYSVSYFDKCNRSCSTHCMDINPDLDICYWGNGTCLHGCKTGYWGSTCNESCPINCKNDICDRINGHCSDGCEAGYWGTKCQDECPSNCYNDMCYRGTQRCIYGCKPGFWGTLCTNDCPSNCNNSKCNQQSEQCSNGCKPGYWGPKCLQVCSLNCMENRCHRNTGLCDCIAGYYWLDDTKMCGPCNTKCANTCDPKDGLCECDPPFYGVNCSLTCGTDCKGQKCNRDGLCGSECITGRHGKHCHMDCPERCPQCDKYTGNCKGVCIEGYDGNSCQKLVIPVTDNTGVIIAIVLALTIVIFIILITYCCWKKRQSGDYVLEDEEREPASKPKQIDKLHVPPTLVMQPLVTGLGKSTDMVDMDDKDAEPGIYTGPKRNTYVSSSVVMTTNQNDVNDDVVIQDPENEPEDTGTARTSWSVDAKYIDVSSTDDELDGYGEDGSVTNEGKVMNDFDREANLPPDTPDDSDHELNEPLIRSNMAPLASEENILMSKENLLEETGQLESQDDKDDERSISIKSSTSSKSSKSSSSDDSSERSSNAGINKDSDSAISDQ